jgi:hypothetical protein
MNLVLQVTQDEFDTVSKLEKLGWIRPEGITVGLTGVIATVPIALTDAGGVGVVAGAGVVTGGAVVSSGTVVSAPATGFDAIFPWVLEAEGGWTDDPKDPGGPTMYGIDTRDDEAAWKALGVTDLRKLTIDQAKTIYKSKYWDTAQCGTMPTPVAETHFNYAVNVGASQSVKFLQGSLGIKIDGQYGPVTQAALAGRVDHQVVALGMVDAADSFYHGLAAQERFEGDLKGWLSRNAGLREWIKQH